MVEAPVENQLAAFLVVILNDVFSLAADAKQSLRAGTGHLERPARHGQPAKMRIAELMLFGSRSNPQSLHSSGPAGKRRREAIVNPIDVDECWSRARSQGSNSLRAGNRCSCCHRNRRKRPNSSGWRTWPRASYSSSRRRPKGAKWSSCVFPRQGRIIGGSSFHSRELVRRDSWPRPLTGIQPQRLGWQPVRDASAQRPSVHRRVVDHFLSCPRPEGVEEHDVDVVAHPAY